MIVEAHVLQFLERRGDGVIASRFVRGIPVGHGRTGGDEQCIAVFRQLRAVESQAGGLFFGVDLSGPAWNGDAASGNTARSFILAALRESWYLALREVRAQRELKR